MGIVRWWRKQGEGHNGVADESEGRTGLQTTGRRWRGERIGEIGAGGGGGGSEWWSIRWTGRGTGITGLGKSGVREGMVHREGGGCAEVGR